MNGYTQIQINGNAVGLKFAYPAIKFFTEETLKPGKTDIYFVGEGTFTTEGLSKLLECAYKNNCLIKEVEPVLTYEDFFNYTEQAQETEEGQKDLVRVMEVYADSSVSKRIVDSQKKNQTSQSTLTE